MPKRSRHRLTAAVCLTAAVVSALPTITLAATTQSTQPAKSPATVPATPMTDGIDTPAVITAPTSRPSSARTAQSFSTAVVTKTVAASTTGPATAPSTAPTSAASPTVAAAPPFHPAPASTQPIDIAADGELAERLCGIAQASIPQKVKSNDLWPAIWQQSGALLSASVKLNSAEARFARLLAEVMLQQGDDQGAIDALGKAHAADKSDQGSQVQIIDLYVNRMETAVEKIKYLKYLLGSSAIAEPIRAHAGVMCASLMFDRGQTEAAQNILGESLRLNPFNSAGLRLRYGTLPAKASNFERCSALIEILHANPAQPEIAASLADKLASVGLVDDSLPWFNLAASLYSRQGRPNLDLALNLACELFIANQNGAASNLTNQLCKVSPGASGNWFLKILIAHSRGDEAAYQKTIQEADSALTTSLMALLPKPPDSTPPPTPADPNAKVALPDLQPAVAEMSKPNAPQRSRFLLALGDLATLQVYFAQRPGDAAPVIAAMRQLDPQSTVVTRLEGFSAVYNGKPDEAKKYFEACHGKDPLGELGLIRLQATDPARVQAASLAGRALLNAHPSGLLGAFLIDGLRDLHGEIIPSKEADALKAQLEVFPTDWLRVIDSPSNFYALRVDPIDSARDYAQPLLGRLTVFNLSDNPLPIGKDGVLKPDLWFNARVRGIADQQTTAVAYDRLAGPLVLQPHETFAQTVRLDQGALQTALDSNFTETIEVTGNVISNPQALSNGTVMAGPGGYSVTFAHPFSRSAEPLTSPAAQKSLTEISAGTPEDKFAAIDLLAAYVKYLTANPNTGDPNQGQTMGVFEDALHKATNDPTPAVAAWASLTAVQNTPSANAEQQITDLSQSADWRTRQISLIATDAMPPAVQRRIASALTADPEPSVRTAAIARIKYLDLNAKP